MDELSKGMTQTGSAAITDKIQENDGPPAVVLASAACLECERVRAACERLGAVQPAPPADALPPPPPPPAQPSYLVTTPFEGELFDAAHKAKYSCSKLSNCTDGIGLIIDGSGADVELINIQNKMAFTKDHKQAETTEPTGPPSAFTAADSLILALRISTSEMKYSFVEIDEDNVRRNDS
ncbi:unnamed protein product [Plutella xylostella]|uniref:(diamondback moth) hypothetical protein n=1 Tax=Plutella xylostella TaxID=51655 RepID=A0A8S4DUT4_PLUXY|nr:unnamed protein product [Plutella xylostella]